MGGWVGGGSWRGGVSECKGKSVGGEVAVGCK